MDKQPNMRIWGMPIDPKVAGEIAEQDYNLESGTPRRDATCSFKVAGMCRRTGLAPGHKGKGRRKEDIGKGNGK